MTVSNTSPLIALHPVQRLALLRELCTAVIVPPAVIREASPSVRLPQWVVEQPLSQPIGARVLQASLGAGESEAISLALKIGSSYILLDDRPARRLAQGPGPHLSGTVGILLAAKRMQLVPAIQPLLDELLRVNFYIAPRLYEQALISAGESRGASPVSGRGPNPAADTLDFGALDDEE